MKDLMRDHAEWYARREFDSTAVSTLMIGLMEEVGELAQAILLTGHCTDYKPSDRKNDPECDDAKRIDWEIGDIITYLLGICAALDIETYFWWREQTSR